MRRRSRLPPAPVAPEIISDRFWGYVYSSSSPSNEVQSDASEEWSSSDGESSASNDINIFCIAVGSFNGIFFGNAESLEETCRVAIPISSSEYPYRVAVSSSLSEPMVVIGRQARYQFDEPQLPSKAYSLNLRKMTEGGKCGLDPKPNCIFYQHRGGIDVIKCLASASEFDSTRVISGSLCSDCFVWDGVTGKRLLRLERAPVDTNSILQVPQWNPAEVFVAGCDLSNYRQQNRVGVLKRFDLESGRATHEFQGCDSKGFCGISADVRRNVVISGAWRKQLMLWSMDSMKPVRKFTANGGPDMIEFAPESNQILVGIYRGSIEFWDIRKLRKSVGILNLARFEPARFHPFRDGSHRFIATCQSEENHMYVFDAQTRKIIKKQPLPLGNGKDRTYDCGVFSIQDFVVDNVRERVDFVMEFLEMICSWIVEVGELRLVVPAFMFH